MHCDSWVASNIYLQFLTEHKVIFQLFFIVLMHLQWGCNATACLQWHCSPLLCTLRAFNSENLHNMNVKFCIKYTSVKLLFFFLFILGVVMWELFSYLTDLKTSNKRDKKKNLSSARGGRHIQINQQRVEDRLTLKPL